MLGVLVSTVRRSLADRPDISERMKARVRALAEEHGYVGLGDAPWFRRWRPGLTKMAMPTYELAYGYSGRLMRQIREYAQASAGSPRVRAVHSPTRRMSGSAARV